MSAEPGGISMENNGRPFLKLMFGLTGLILLINVSIMLCLVPVTADESSEVITDSDQTANSRAFSGRTSHNWQKMFGGFLNDGISHSYGPQSNSTLWTYETDGEVFSSPTIAGGRLFIGSWDKKLYALNAETGAWLWEFDTGDFVYSTPTYHNGIVYIGTGIELGEDVKKLFAINAVTGTKVWEHQFDKNIYGSAVIHNDILYIGCADGYLYAMDPAGNGDGTTSVLWQFKTGKEIWSSPAIYGNDIFITSTDAKLYSINMTTHEENWNFTAEGDIDAIYSSPTIDGEGRVFFGSAWQPDGRFYALNIETGAELWNISTGTSRYGVCTTAAVRDGIVFVGSNNGIMYALNSATGSEIWNYTTGDIWNGIYSSAVVANNHIYFGSSDGFMYCLKEKSGDLVWKLETGGGEYGVVSSPAVLNGRVYFGSNDWTVYSVGLPHTGEIQIDLSAEPDTLSPNENSTITVRTYNGSIALGGVKITMTTVDGRFSTINARSDTSHSTRTSILIGSTDIDGIYKCRYTAPETNTKLFVQIEVEATGEGLKTNQSSTHITVNPGKQLAMEMTPTKNSYFMAEPININIEITGDGAAVENALVNYTISYGTTEFSNYGFGDHNGLFNIVHAAPDVSVETSVKVTVRASKSGFNPVSSEITVTVIPQLANEMDISVSTDPPNVVSGKQTEVTVTVLNGTGGEALSGVVLKFHINLGTLSISEGTTGSDGKLKLTYTAPTGISENVKQELVLTANIIDFKETTAKHNISVLVSDNGDGTNGDEDDGDSSGFFSSPGFFAATAVLIIVIIIAVIFLMKSKSKREELEKSEEEEEQRVEKKKD
jgi:outer membrane protein assembly factor BamB